MNVPRTLIFDLAIVLGGTVVLTGIALALDLDLRIAAATVDLQATAFGDLGNRLSKWNFQAAVPLLALLAIPPLRRRWPELSRCAAIYVLTLLIGVLAGVHNLKSETSRPRPNQVVEFGGEYAIRPPFGSEPTCKRCVSFPSSSAGLGFLAMTPAFALRRRHPRVAVGFLVGGLAWGGFIGWTRMVSGNHWATDVLWSLALVAAPAAVLSHLQVAWRGSE